MVDFLVSNADKSAFLAAISWILGFIALFIFFAVGGIFGPINDAFSIFQFLLLIPVALALNRILGSEAPVIAFLATILGIAAMLAFAALQTLLLLRRVEFEQTLRPILVLGAVVGAWWFIMSVLSLIQEALPTGLGWIGIVLGASLILGAVGFWIGGQQHPLTVVAFLAGAILAPVWLFWLGRVLASV